MTFWLWYQDTNLIRLTTVGREFQYLVIAEEIKCPPKSADLTESLAIPNYQAHKSLCSQDPARIRILQRVLRRNANHLGIAYRSNFHMSSTLGDICQASLRSGWCGHRPGRMDIAEGGRRSRRRAGPRRSQEGRD
jgi:hypothetical protein